MPAQQRVQQYLEKHKIGSIFEGLMAKLISEMPDDPLQYMVRNLQRRIDRQEGGGTRKTLAGRNTSPMRRSLPVTSSSADAVGTVKDYEKPWQVKAKKIRPKKTTTEGIEDRPEWDHRTKSKLTTFDELWEDKEVATKSRAVRSSPSPPMKTVGFLGESEDFSSYAYRGPCAPRSDEEDPLAGEFPANSQRHADCTTPSVSVIDLRAAKSSSTKSDVLQRRMSAITAEKSDRDSGIEEDRDLVHDEAVELLEDEDDLLNEGVKNVKISGTRRSQMPRQPKNDTMVSVSICGRCARVMTGEPSEPLDGYGQLPDYDNDREFPESRPQSTRRDNETASDEEFESVSQVTGPRRPVWDEVSDVQEQRTPRKGNHMFSSTNIPAKGRPMFSSEIPDWGHTPNKRERHEGQHSMAVEVKGQQQRHPVNHSWAPGMRQTDQWDFNTQKEADRKVASPGGEDSHRVWQIDEGSGEEDESSFYGGGGVTQDSRSSKNRLTYQGAY